MRDYSAPDELRWQIAGLLALAMALNYLDRQSLGIVIGEVQKELPLNDLEYSKLQSYFLLGYAVMYAAGGRLVDWTGSRMGYVIVIVWWSIATALQGFAHNIAELGIARLLLGLGEGGAFPAAAKVVSERFPVEERSLAVGIYNTGSSVGATIAAPLVAFVAYVLHWRAVFYITGVMGILWAISWAAIVPAVKAARRAPLPWLHLLRVRETWGLILSKFFSDSAWYFLMLWLPRYLGEARGLRIGGIGYYAWIPFAFAAFGSFSGGWLSSYLVRRGVSVDRSRRATLLLSASLMPVVLFIVRSPLYLAILFFCVAAFAHQFWAAILQTLPVDMFAPETVGSVSGIMGSAGAFGGVIFNMLIGALLADYHSYTIVFSITAFLHLTAFAIITVLIPRIELLRLNTPPMASLYEIIPLKPR